MNLAYLAGPLRDPAAPEEMTPRRELNILRALAAAQALAASGVYPIAPHLLTGRMIGVLSEESALAGARQILVALAEVEGSAVHLLEGWDESAGTLEEIALASDLGLPIFLPDGSPLRVFVSGGEIRMVHTTRGLLFAETRP